MDAKYIVVKMHTDETEHEVIVVFPAIVNHAVMAAKLAGGKPVLGAGFCNPQEQCFGESDSLKIKARPKDSALYKVFIGKINRTE